MSPILPPRLINVSVRTAHHGLEACFGYGVIPGSRGEVDCPLHVVVFLDKPVYAGSCIASRVIGMIGNYCLVAVAENATLRYESLEEVAPFALLEVESFLCEKGWQVYRPRHGVEEACDRLAAALCRGIEPGRNVLHPPRFASLS